MINQQDNEQSKKSSVEGLSSEIGKVIRDPEFQITVNKFIPKHETFFRISKGAGIAFALMSGLFGYLLKANSEADDRKVEAIHKIIDEKKKWLIQVNESALAVRKIRFLIRYDCDHGKKISLYEQEKIRFSARHELVKSFIGLNEIFGKNVYQLFLNFTKFDESITDVCAKDAPDDEAWRVLLKKINEEMQQSIAENRNQIDELSKGILSEIFTVI